MTSPRVHVPERAQPSLVRRGQVPLRAANPRALILSLEGALADASEMTQPLNDLLWRTHLPRWKQLRGDLARAENDAYQEVRVWAESKQKAGAEVRALLAFAFDAEPYADALLREARGFGDKSVFALALVNAREVETLADVGAWLARFKPEVVVERGEDVLENFATEPLALERIFLAWAKAVDDATKRPKGAQHAWGLVDASKTMLDLLACVGTTAVATRITEELGTARGKQLATRYFKRFPELAEGALRPLTKKRSKAGEVAKVLLGVLPQDEASEAPASAEVTLTDATSDGPDILADPPWRRWRKAGMLVLKDLPTPAFALPPEAAAKHDRHAWAAKLPSVPLGVMMSSGAALMVAQLWFTRRPERAAAEEWMQAFAPIATYGLLPFVLGPPGTSRTIGTAALRFLWKSVGEERGKKIVERWCADAGQAAPEVVPGVLAILHADARWECPASAPAAPTFLAPSTLPALLMRDGALLSETSRKHLIEMMIFAGETGGEQTQEYVGAAEVREALTPDSLEAFSWALYETWSALGSSTRTSWPLGQLALFGGRNTAHRLGAHIRSLAMEKSVERALEATQVLARLPRDLGLLHVHGLMETAKSERVKGRAKELLKEAADARGLSLDALLDGLVPDAPTSEEVEVATKAQRKHLERAMCEGRTWPMQVFRARLLAHPLLRSIAAGLLWSQTLPDGARLLFRVAEDASLADVHDAQVTLHEDAQIGIPHALHLSAEACAAWGQVWADYQLTQPFPQLGREAFVLTPEERAAPVLTRLIGLHGETALFFALEQRGWTILGHRTETYGAEKFQLRFTVASTVNLVRPKETPVFDIAHAAFMRPASEMEASETLRDLAALTRG